MGACGGNANGAAMTISGLAVSATALSSCEYAVIALVVGTGEALGVADGVAVIGIGVNGVGTAVSGVRVGVARVLRQNA